PARGAQLARDREARGDVVPGQHQGEHRVGGDDVFAIAHGVFPASATRRTQSLPASRCRLSARARASSEPANQNLVPITIQTSGGSMLGSIEDSPNTRMVWPWCSEFHHTTEYRITGSITTPTSA